MDRMHRIKRESIYSSFILLILSILFESALNLRPFANRIVLLDL